MKIIAIRGQNLASLQGDFEVRFDAGPLASAGLFAITGPTGSGKSTLLDCLCLALYDRTPRYASIGGVSIGPRGAEQRLGANDVRHLLRRGTAFAFAEVDFVAQDRSRWRARWEVRRSRNKISGRIQSQKMSLMGLDDEGILFSKKKTEVLHEIEKRVGLSFEQFRRSVLLAQGDFAAFLKAKPDQRSELLERMTGTALYSQLSKAAHERERAEREALQDLERESNAKDLLSDEARKGLDAELAAKKQELEAGRAALQQLKLAEAWYGQWQQLDKNQRLAQGHMQAAQATWANAEARRQRLALIDSCQPLRGPLQQVGNLQTALKKAQMKAKNLDIQFKEVEVSAQGRAKALKAAEGARLVALKTREDKRPELEQARALDQDLARLIEDGKALRKSEVKAKVEAEKKGAALKATQQKIGAAQARLEGARIALEAQQAMEGLHDQWQRWQADLQDQIQNHQRLKQAKKAEADLQKVQQGKTRQREALNQRMAVLQAQKADEKSKLEKAQGEAAQIDRQKLAAALKVDGQRGSLVERMRSLLRGHQRVVSNQTQNAQSLKAGQDKLAGCKKALAAAQGAIQQHKLLHGEATLALNRWLASQKLMGYRAQLKAGEACPLCGAEDHPFAQKDDVLAENLRQQEARVKELDGLLQKAQGEAAHAEARGKQLQARLQEWQAEGEALAQEKAELEAEWQGACADFQAADETSDLGTAWQDIHQKRADFESWAEAMGQAMQGRQRAFDGLGAIDARISASQKTLEKIRSEVQDLDGESLRLDKSLSQGETRLAEKKLERAGAKREQDQLFQRLAGALKGLDEFEALFFDDPKGLLIRAEAAYRAYDAPFKARQESEVALQALKPQASKEAAEDDGARDAWEKVKGEIEICLNRYAGLKTQRDGLLGGQKTDAMHRQLESAFTTADAALVEAQGQAQEVQRQAAILAQQLSDTKTAVGETEAGLAKAQGALAEALLAVKIERAEAESLLEKGVEWVQSERRALDDLQAKKQEMQVRLEAAAKALKAHGEKDPPPWPADDLADLMGAKTSEIAQWETVYAARLGLREMDDKLRLKLSEIKPKIDGARATWSRWKQLSELIGSADGKKFRMIAQSLTLEQLLAHANHHLRELVRRYHLERVPGEDLAIQVVDRHMGDEIRGVNSLSGGEGFLVSLALALGLASLSSKDVRIESLFIDEGFGTLDQDTLEMALATLDTLQASGRKVGLISHVPGMAERIGYQVEVKPVGAGQSKIRVRSPQSSPGF